MTSLTIADQPTQTAAVETVSFEPNRSGSEVFPFDDVRTLDFSVHDPSIIDWDGTFLMVTTSPSECCPIWSSSDRVNWKPHGPAMPIPPDWLMEAVPLHRSVWAPDLVRVGDALRLYYCASQRFGDNTSFIGFAENPTFDPKRPSEGWIDGGKLVQSNSGADNFNAIDPDVETGPDGRHWMVYGSYWSGIYLVELDALKGGLKHPDRPAIHVASNTGEPGNPLEAPALCFRDGYYYLFVTYGLAAQGIRSSYRMMVGRSSEPEGPYLGYDGAPMTEGGHTDVLKSSPPMFGPGGGNVFQDADGHWWMAYHYYDSRKHWHADTWGLPTLHVRSIVWGADGWPLPGLPAGFNLLPPHGQGLAGEWIFQRNFREPIALVLTAGGEARADGSHGKWTGGERNISIRWNSSEGKTATTVVDNLLIDETHQYFVGRDATGAVVRGIRKDAQVGRL